MDKPSIEILYKIYLMNKFQNGTYSMISYTQNTQRNTILKTTYTCKKTTKTHTYVIKVVDDFLFYSHIFEIFY